jgi:acyl-coenzyme A synthetase/AMP-(fatty) acid ligase
MSFSRLYNLKTNRTTVITRQVQVQPRTGIAVTVSPSSPSNNPRASYHRAQTRHPPSFVERRQRPSEGKTRVAFLNFSSGTTGKPKVGAIYSVTSIGLIFYHDQAVDIFILHGGPSHALWNRASSTGTGTRLHWQFLLQYYARLSFIGLTYARANAFVRT